MFRRFSVKAASQLEPTFARHSGSNGRISIQTDPRLYRDLGAIVEQAVEFSRLAPNVIVKIPAIPVGIAAIEEVTYRGVSVNATVSFTLAQALAVGDAVERGLRRREAEGLDVATMGPGCTPLIRRLADLLQLAVQRHSLSPHPPH